MSGSADTPAGAAAGTPTTPDPKGDRRRGRGRRGQQPAAAQPPTAGQAPEVSATAEAARQPTPAQPVAGGSVAAAGDDRAAGEYPAEYPGEYPASAEGDASAFYRFSAALGVLALVLLAGAAVWYSVVSRVDRNVGVLVAIAALLGVLYVIPRAGELSSALRSRTARQGGSATLLSVAFIGLLVVGNWFANRHSPQWDLTAAKRYTLSDQTLKIVRSLDRDVKVTAFFPSRQEDTYIRGTKDLLRQYDRQSERITLEFIDPDLNPGAARQYDIQSYPITVFQAGDRKEQTTGVTEQDFTSALLKLTRTQQKKVYFVQGHQERDPDSAQQNGLSQAVDALKRENYAVDKLNLLTTPRVPDDAAVLVIAGPRSPFSDAERQALADYLGRGGHVFFLAERGQDVGLAPLFEQWHVSINNDVVVEEERAYLGDPLTPVPVVQGGHRISSSLPNLLLPASRSVAIRPGAGSELAIAPLLTTSQRSWADSNLNPPFQFNPGEDKQGPFNLAVAVNRADPAPAFSPGATPTPSAGDQAPKGRLVVVGNTEFASNNLLSQVLGNRDFFVNSVNWLAEDEDLISIRATPAGAPPIVLTAQSQWLVLYASVVFVPLAVLLLGGVVWWQRR
jgi:ABC-type uncharacterized transport system involved in gliding motility auxiliary subunit